MMKRPIRDGFLLVRRHQRLVWWIFFVNLALGFLASVAPRSLFQSSLNRSLYSNQLSQRFDVTVLLELLSKPEVSLAPLYAGSTAVAFVFVIYMLFISGGVLSVYRDDRKLGRGEFFEACGDFFWRMVRLMLCSVIPFGIAIALYAGVHVLSGKMAKNAPLEMQGFWVQIGGFILCLLFALFVRAWFDVAQARTVCDRVRGMFVLSFRTFLLALRNLPRLVFIYFAITLIGGLVLAVGWLVWLRIPHGSLGWTWITLEFFTLVMIGLRLWQRAAALLWYENYAESHAMAVPPVPMPSPPRDVVVIDAPAQDPVPLSGGGESAI